MCARSVESGKSLLPHHSERVCSAELLDELDDLVKKKACGSPRESFGLAETKKELTESDDELYTAKTHITPSASLGTCTRSKPLPEPFITTQGNVADCYLPNKVVRIRRKRKVLVRRKTEMEQVLCGFRNRNEYIVLRSGKKICSNKSAHTECKRRSCHYCKCKCHF